MLSLLHKIRLCFFFPQMKKRTGCKTIFLRQHAGVFQCRHVLSVPHLLLSGFSALNIPLNIGTIMPPKKKSNTFLYAVIALLFLGGVGFLVFQGLQENSTYFLDVAEAKSQDPSKLSNIRLFGTVAGEDIARPEKGTGVSFTLEDQFDKTNTLHVVYTGIVPDTFKEGAEVIIEGDLEKNGVFQARVLMTKCPSKYQKENRS